MKKFAASIAGLSLIGIFHVILPAQSGASVWDGVYTEDQATRGEPVYQQQCGSCHGKDLSGNGQTPPLSGSDFMMNWNGLSVGDLFDRIRTSMPADHPGALTPEQYTDSLAFILKDNKFPAGKKDLPSDSESLKQIRLETAKPKSIVRQCLLAAGAAKKTDPRDKMPAFFSVKLHKLRGSGDVIYRRCIRRVGQVVRSAPYRETIPRER